MKAFKYLIVVLVLFTSCNNDDDNTVETCTNHGLFYTLDTNAEVYLPQGGTNSSATVYTQSNTGTEDSVIVHELENNFLFQSSATDLNQTSMFDSDIASSEASHLFINNVLSSPIATDITFSCIVNDAVVGGTIRYVFSGTFTSSTNVQHTIEGQVCAIIETLN
ncbi:hypothetical protein [Olleya sp. R77988]|uniref:hypothetical protein n=1 Tax=Olleya sp. R77988 TaxID=3093875 RepID=UPI0037CB1F97